MLVNQRKQNRFSSLWNLHKFRALLYLCCTWSAIFDFFPCTGDQVRAATSFLQLTSANTRMQLDIKPSISVLKSKTWSACWLLLENGITCLGETWTITFSFPCQLPKHASNHLMCSGTHKECNQIETQCRCNPVVTSRYCKSLAFPALL